MFEEIEYRVAGWVLKIYLPTGYDVNGLLPSFEPFRCESHTYEPALLTFTVASSPLPVTDTLSVVEEVSNDMGHLRLLATSTGYAVELRTTPTAPLHTLQADHRFTAATAGVDWSDPNIGLVLTSLLRIVYSQAILLHGGISVHAAAVVWGNRAVLFMGKSGTGKSTHAALWLSNFPDSHLLNDDNPTLRLEGDKVMAYGTPWSGKTPCYRNQGYPVEGIARLSQAPHNSFIRCTDVDAFVAMLPGCSAISVDSTLHNSMCDTLARIAEIVTIGRLECRPDNEAAHTCAAALLRDYNTLHIS